MLCPHCGARQNEAVAECASCGTKLAKLVTLEEEIKVMLVALEERLHSESESGSKASSIVSFLFFMSAVPLSFFLLPWSLLARIIIAPFVALIGFLCFGWSLHFLEARAEAAAWEKHVGPSLRRFAERKSLSLSELATYGDRVLRKRSKLRKYLTG